MSLADASAQRLLAIARASIEHGLNHGTPLPVDLAREPHELGAVRAAFVTLHLHGQLRGCIGSIEAHRPLAEEVAGQAFAAAFEDPRFSPVTSEEAGRLEIHVSILTPPEPLPCRDESDLLNQLRPGRDGLILQDGHRRATFLPSVWDELPEPRQFLDHLKRKAGLPAQYWKNTLRFWRYEAESVGSP